MIRSQYNSEKNYVSIEEKARLLSYLQEHFRLDFRDYSEASVRRRFSKILNEHGLQSVDQYIDLLNEDENAIDLFLEKFTVNVTEMFRDPYCYEGLVTHSFPELRKKKKVKIWSAGCSSGEEVLSLAILLKEQQLLDKCSILATDLSPLVLETARQGIYQLRHLNSYGSAYLDSGGKKQLDHYYQRINNDEARFSSDLLDHIEYRQHNLAEAPPADDFDLVICRNVLIYFNATLQNRVIDKLTASLIKGGDLFIGSKETILFYQQRQRYQELTPEIKLYRKLS